MWCGYSLMDCGYRQSHGTARSDGGSDPVSERCQIFVAICAKQYHYIPVLLMINTFLQNFRLTGLPDFNTPNKHLNCSRQYPPAHSVYMYASL
jgi:hypothetical protein